jgi:hypothetical protein
MRRRRDLAAAVARMPVTALLVTSPCSAVSSLMTAKAAGMHSDTSVTVVIAGA